MKNNKKKGRSFEREVYKRLRELNTFKEVKLTLGSGSSDELHDILADEYVIECKKGKMYNDKLLLRIFNSMVKENIKNPILIYRQPYKEIMVMKQGKQQLPIIMYFDDWMKTL
jgi:Holliday junction resolvase